MIQTFGLPNPAKSLPWAIRSNIIKAMKEAAKHVEQVAKDKYLSGKGRATNTLNLRSGTLRDSIKGVGYKGPAGYIASMEIGSDVKYAEIHEYGGMIEHPGANTFASGRPMIFYVDNPRNKRRNWIRTYMTEAHNIWIPARPFLSRAVKSSESYISMLLDKAMEDALKE